MINLASAEFEIRSWNEEPYDSPEGAPGLAGVRVTKAFEGDIEGESTLDYLMAHGSDGTSSFVGLERFSGTLAGKKGTFVLQHVGGFEDGVATSSAHVVQASGTGDLEGLRGDTQFSAGHHQKYPITLRYEIV